MDRTVVADLVSRISERTVVETPVRVIVVGGPGRIGGLEQNLRVPFVIAHDKRDVTRSCDAVVAHEPGDVNSGNGVSGDTPGCRDGPIAAVDQGSGRIVRTRIDAEAGWLRRSRRREIRNVSDETCAIAAVIAEAVDVNVIVADGCLDFEGNGLAVVDADVGSKPL